MYQSWDSIKGLKVTTESGIRIGKVCGLCIDIETHTISQYEVKQRHLTHTSHFLIHRNSVVSISETEMIVKDAGIYEELPTSFSERSNLAGGIVSSSSTVINYEHD